MKANPSLRRCGYFLCTSVAASFGQTMPPPESRGEAIVQLSPFEVSTTGDRGYLSTSAVSATRVAEELKNIPQTVLVINEELIADLAARTLDDILAYTAGIDLAGNENEDYDIRGLSSGQGMMDGFRQPRQFPEDSFDVERVEIMMGPSSVMFGSSAGDNGIINRQSKRPKTTRESSLQFNYTDATGYLRFGADATGPLGRSRRLSYRLLVNVTDERRPHLKDHAYARRYSIAPKFSYRFSPDTHMFVHTEFSRTETSLGQQLGRNYDYVTYRTAAGTFVNNPTTAGQPNVPVLVDVPDASNPEAHLVLGNMRAYRIRPNLTSRLSPHWALRVAGSSGRTITRFNVPNVAAALNTNGRTINRGRPQERTRSVWQNFLQVDLAGEYRFDWGRVKLIGGPDYTIDNQANHLRRAIPTGSLPAFDYFAPDYSVRLPEMNEQSDTLSHTRILAAFANGQASLLRDRMLLTAGARYTDFEQTSRTQNTHGPVPIEGDLASQPQFGVTVRPHPDMGVYASYTENIVIRSNANPDGTLLPPRVTEQEEVGTKALLFNGRVAMQLAYFESTATNILEDDPERPGFQIATGEQTTKGWEVNSTATLTDTWQLIAGFTHMSKAVSASVDASAVGRQVLLPKERWTLWTRYRVPTGWLQGLAFGTGIRYSTERVQALETVTTAKRAMPAYTIYEAMVSYRPRGRSLSLQLNVKNLTDEKYYLRGTANRWAVAPPRAISFTASYRLR